GLMSELEQLLNVSEQLYSHLENTPSEEDRTQFIDQMNVLIDVREEIIHKLDKTKTPTNGLYNQLLELDKGIKEHMIKVLNIIKEDLKDLQQKKKHESSYSNPYAATQVIDGMFFDNKK
ncbi:MAG: flagellar protein FliT, partial [Psychrobacillus psychrotolerans]|uniref:flagellar protein FliT n=1 Tax=Psychrobacillus psychrotolerans TaxID=126156 RepID=UPI003BAE5B4B